MRRFWLLSVEGHRIDVQLNDVVAALEAYECAVAEALRERRVPTPCGPENAYGLDDPWNDPWNEHESGDRGQVDEDALGARFAFERPGARGQDTPSIEGRWLGLGGGRVSRRQRGLGSCGSGIAT